MICYLKGGYKHGSDALSLRNENRRAQWDDCSLQPGAPRANLVGKPPARTGKGVGEGRPLSGCGRGSGCALVILGVPWPARGPPLQQFPFSCLFVLPFHSLGGRYNVGSVRDKGKTAHRIVRFPQPMGGAQVSTVLLFLALAGSLGKVTCENTW